jgi:hypothetical protein
MITVSNKYDFCFEARVQFFYVLMDKKYAKRKSEL